MIRVVIDINVYISGLMFGGLPGSLLDLAFLRSFVLLISPALLDELVEKLRLKRATQFWPYDHAEATTGSSWE